MSNYFNAGDISTEVDNVDLVLNKLNEYLGIQLTRKSVFVQGNIATIGINELYGDISTSLEKLITDLKKENVFPSGCITEFGSEKTEYRFEKGTFETVSEWEATLESYSDEELWKELAKRNSPVLSELNAYDDNHELTISSGNEEDLESFQIILRIQNDRYCCHISARSVEEALGIFFVHHPHVRYEDIEEPSSGSIVEKYPRIYKSTILEGWCWHHYEDGSGGLDTPDGKHYLSYDLTTREYEFEGKGWNFFPNYPDHMSRKDFYSFIEELISARGI